MDTILINTQPHNSSRDAPRGWSDGDFHQEFYPVPNLWVVLCVCYNAYLVPVVCTCVYFTTCLSGYAKSVASVTAAPTLTPSAKRMCSTTLDS